MPNFIRAISSVDCCAVQQFNRQSLEYQLIASLKSRSAVKVIFDSCMEALRDRGRRD
jgi:hypothetical protein